MKKRPGPPESKTSEFVVNLTFPKASSWIVEEWALEMTPGMVKVFWGQAATAERSEFVWHCLHLPAREWNDLFFGQDRQRFYTDCGAYLEDELGGTARESIEAKGRIERNVFCSNIHLVRTAGLVSCGIHSINPIAVQQFGTKASKDVWQHFEGYYILDLPIVVGLWSGISKVGPLPGPGRT